MRDPKALLDLRQHSSKEQKRWGDAFWNFMLLLTVQQAKRIVFKSPPHGFRLPLLSSMFPQARYVVIQRNPYEVFASNLKLWQTLIGLYAVESASAAEIEQFVLAAYILHEEAIAEGISVTNANRLVCVRYEDLTAHPIRQMKRLYEELELGNFDLVRGPMEKYVANAAGYARNRFTLSPVQKASVDGAWGPLIEAKGYCWPEQYLSLAGLR
jgi:hypothetical protein